MQTNFETAQERHDAAAPEYDDMQERIEELADQFDDNGCTDHFDASDVSRYMHDQWPEETGNAMAKIARGDYVDGLAEYEGLLVLAVEAMARDTALEERV